MYTDKLSEALPGCLEGSSRDEMRDSGLLVRVAAHKLPPIIRPVSDLATAAPVRRSFELKCSTNFWAPAKSGYDDSGLDHMAFSPNSMYSEIHIFDPFAFIFLKISFFVQAFSCRCNLRISSTPFQRPNDYRGVRWVRSIKIHAHKA